MAGGSVRGELHGDAGFRHHPFWNSTDGFVNFAGNWTPSGIPGTSTSTTPPSTTTASPD